MATVSKKKVRKSSPVVKKAPLPHQVNRLQALTNEIQLIRNTYSQLAKVVEVNTRSFAESFHMVDAHINVMRRALNDVVLGKCLKAETGDIDFTQYLIDYWCHVGFSNFVHGLRKEAESKAPVTKPVVNEDVTVFGG